MERVVPWGALVELVAPHAPEGKKGRPPFAVQTERHKLAEQMLASVNELLQGKGLLLKVSTVVDATLIAAPSPTKNAGGQRDPEMHQTKKGNQWHVGMKAHIGVDAESGLVHTVRATAANVSDVVQANSLLHVQESDVFADAGYQGEDGQLQP